MPLSPSQISTDGCFGGLPGASSKAHTTVPTRTGPDSTASLCGGWGAWGGSIHVDCLHGAHSPQKGNKTSETLMSYAGGPWGAARGLANIRSPWPGLCHLKPTGKPSLPAVSWTQVLWGAACRPGRSRTGSNPPECTWGKENQANLFQKQLRPTESRSVSSGQGCRRHHLCSTFACFLQMEISVTGKVSLSLKRRRPGQQGPPDRLCGTQQES